MDNLHVENIHVRDRAIPNQFVIQYKDVTRLGVPTLTQIFQSYESKIVEIKRYPDKRDIFLDEIFWDFSRTTSKYRSLFLQESKKETQSKIDSGEYILKDLNYNG